MKLNVIKNVALQASILLISVGCSVDHTGLLPSDIEGQQHLVTCRIEIAHEVTVAGIAVPVTTNVTPPPTADVCSNGAPGTRLMNRACDEAASRNVANFEMMNPGGFVGVEITEPVSSALVEAEDPCFIPNVAEGEGEVLSRTDELSSGSDISGSHVQVDELGKLLSKDSLNNSHAKLVSSNVTVGAKFLKWRYANTVAHGALDFDRFNCNASGECDIVLRKISLDFDDFTIVRPSIFARDVPVSGARLYSITSHTARVDRDGKFEIENVNAIISSVVDGERVNLLSSQDVKIVGKFDHNLHGQNHAALTLDLVIGQSNERFSVKANAAFEVHKFPSKLATGKTSPLCLTGGERTTYREARVTKCDSKSAYQAWSLETKGRYLRIRQPLMNTCLNVKSDSQNYDGGIVSIVNCSDHWDQLWAIDNDNNVVNLNTRKCLDIGRNKKRGEDDLVTIHTCESKAGGQDWFVRRPG